MKVNSKDGRMKVNIKLIIGFFIIILFVITRISLDESNNLFNIMTSINLLSFFIVQSYVIRLTYNKMDKYYKGVFSLSQLKNIKRVFTLWTILYLFIIIILLSLYFICFKSYALNDIIAFISLIITIMASVIARKLMDIMKEYERKKEKRIYT